MVYTGKESRNLKEEEFTLAALRLVDRSIVGKANGFWCVLEANGACYIYVYILQASYNNDLELIYLRLLLGW